MRAEGLTIGGGGRGGGTARGEAVGGKRWQQGLQVAELAEDRSEARGGISGKGGRGRVNRRGAFGW